MTAQSQSRDIHRDELNALGRDGWELTGVYADATSVHFYFKRIVD